MRIYTDRFPLSISGYLYLAGFAAFLWLRGPGIAAQFVTSSPAPIGADLLALGLLVFGLLGLFLQPPNMASVLTFLGNYAGTDQSAGLRWTVPVLMQRERVSLRLRNFESTCSKVNDAAGNPVEIAGVIVWRITSPAAATFGVSDVAQYVELQAETALRALASAHAYIGGPDEVSLQGHPAEMAEALRASVQDSVKDAGVEIVEARISHLAYAPEIAAAMLQRQQAEALLKAREVMVQGALDLVEHSVSELSKRGVVEMDDAQRVALVSNLLVVLAGDQAVQPTLNTASSNTG
ncbi:MAG: SPFH domain-containing protein [Pseudomonadota bacterium]